MPSQPKRLPGEKDPGPDTRDVDQLANAALSHGSATQAGAGDGVSGELLGLWASFRRGRAKKRAMAAHEARRHLDGQRE